MTGTFESTTARRRRVARGAIAALLASALLGPITAVDAIAAATIQPGVAIRTGNSGCTLNWIYDRFVRDPETGDLVREGTYGGTAAHCVDEVGQDVFMVAQPSGEQLLRIGHVAFIAPGLDYAFIRVADANQAAVDPSLKGHPQIPTGMSTTSTARTGDIIQFSGNGIGFNMHETTQQRRQGILNGNNGTEHHVIGTVTFGDSGGPVADVTDGNKALGIVNSITIGIGGPSVAHAGEGGLSLQGILADALSRGWDMRLRTI